MLFIKNLRKIVFFSFFSLILIILIILIVGVVVGLEYLKSPVEEVEAPNREFTSTDEQSAFVKATDGQEILIKVRG